MPLDFPFEIIRIFIFHLAGYSLTHLADKIIRELVANTLIHREYSRAFTARLVIEKDQLFIENG